MFLYETWYQFILWPKNWSLPVLCYLLLHHMHRHTWLSAYCCTRTQISASVSTLQIHGECEVAFQRFVICKWQRRLGQSIIDVETLYMMQLKQKSNLNVLCCIVMARIICCINRLQENYAVAWPKHFLFPFLALKWPKGLNHLLIPLLLTALNLSVQTCRAKLTSLRRR